MSEQNQEQTEEQTPLEQVKEQQEKPRPLDQVKELQKINQQALKDTEEQAQNYRTPPEANPAGSPKEHPERKLG